jgi:hypothetical protein
MSNRTTYFGPFCPGRRDASGRHGQEPGDVPLAGERDRTGDAEDPTVELASLILRRSLKSVTPDRESCSRCHRTPVAGEMLHVFESETLLCSLCVARLPEAERSPLRSERVHVSERRLSVVPRAA